MNARGLPQSSHGPCRRTPMNWRERLVTSFFSAADPLPFIHTTPYRRHLMIDAITTIIHTIGSILTTGISGVSHALNQVVGSVTGSI